MIQYFKIVAYREKKVDWMFNEYLEGRVHFGWSGPGSDLRILQKKRNDKILMTSDESITWRRTQFLINRIKKGNRLVIQFEQPLRKFLIAEVTGGYNYTDPEEDDFNHFLECTPLTPDYIDIYSKIISDSLIHDITKRGHYYEIYPDESIKELNELIEHKKWTIEEYTEKRTDESELEKTNEAIIKEVITKISKKWPAKKFEAFIAHVIGKLQGIQVNERADVGLGWDMLIRIYDPITNEILFDDIPVQCKNKTGNVSESEPIDDLARCIKNSGKNLAYLFILGDLSEDYIKKFDTKQEELTKELGKEISFIIVKQDQIAELYMTVMPRL